MRNKVLHSSVPPAEAITAQAGGVPPASSATPSDIEARIARLEAIVATAGLLNTPPTQPKREKYFDDYEFKRAIRAMKNGDKKPFNKYMEKGGIIPTPENLAGLRRH